MDKINLRIGLVDFSSGRASSSFFSGHGNTGASESETDLSDEDEDGLDIITEEEDSEEINSESEYY